MLYGILFLFGLAIGSFMNVLALRYDGDHFLFDPKIIGGRSRCPHCGHTLHWFELIPVISYIIQGAKCRSCGARIGAQYPLVELLSGIIFVAIPLTLASYPGIIEAFWVAAFEVLLLIAYIDLRLGIVPDELTIILGVIAIFQAVFAAAYISPLGQSFFAPYSLLFGLQGSLFLNRLVGAIFGGAFFGALALITKGKGMGMGDVKLGLPLGFLFGWPDIIFLYAAAFVIGAVVGVALIVRYGKTAKSAVPFVPFLALGATFVVFAGQAAISWYFRIIGL